MSKVRATVNSSGGDIALIRFLVLVGGYAAISRFVFDAFWDRSILVGIAVAAVVHLALSFAARRSAS
ncbi:hypothetical protein [Rhodococcoides kyotonense]|uniref:Uncharacterized protein n=1 Tax=Rhodococcoides kyotonense TaxID=398843 RepID=A0A239H1I3_9NOCA|nr:hypothetical protein [Rhodococcus kyotonensis]SNS75279.1 hypothetical protein SAMN05421642_10548 [Rhodococcus kyotonensis]